MNEKQSSMTSLNLKKTKTKVKVVEKSNEVKKIESTLNEKRKELQKEFEKNEEIDRCK